MESLVFYDEKCVLCNSVVRFLLNHKKSFKFKFAALTGDIAKDKLKSINDIPDSIVLIENDNIYFESDAVLRILSQMGWPYSWLYIFKIFPKGIRDRMYRFVARHRHIVFGKIQECTIPLKDE